MATITISNAGGKWGEAGTWVGGVIPTAADDVVAASTSGPLTIPTAYEAVCRSLDLALYGAKTFKTEGTGKLLIGNSEAPPEGRALRLSAAMTITPSSTGELNFVSTSVATQTIELAGKTLSAGKQRFSGAGSVYKCIGATTLSEIVLSKGELNTNGQVVTATNLVIGGTETKVFNFESTTLKLTKATGLLLNIESATGTTVKATGSTLILAPASGTSEFRGAGFTFGNLRFAGPGNVTFTASSGSLTFQKMEFAEGAAGTVVKFGAEKTYTASEVVGNGQAGKLITIESTTAGKAAVLKVATGTVSQDYLSLKDSKAEGGAAFYAGEHSTNVSGNSGWTFTAPEKAPTCTTGEAPPVISADLLGSINPNGAATEVHFEWGTTEAYGSSTPAQAIGSGHSAVAVSALVTGLVAATEYHFRVVAINAKGTVDGKDQAFTASGGAVVSVVL